MQKRGSKLKRITDFQFRVSIFVIIHQLLVYYKNVCATRTLVVQATELNIL